MARPLRIEYPGAFYHVMHRGNAQADIFLSERDREKFLEYLSHSVERYGLKIHTYCLMTNHYHLLVETPESNLSQAIKWINVSYAAYFNRKRRRSGHLFQGRFKAIVVDADEYLKHLSRYIHLNPIRAGMVEQVKDYQWSSFPALSGYKKGPEWLETGWLLSLFGNDKKRYCQFVEEVQRKDIQDPSKDVVRGLILGGSEFVNWIKSTFLSKMESHSEKPQLTGLKPRLRVEDLVSAICDEFGCEREQILHKGLKKNVVRDVAIYLSREMTGASGVALGQYFGGISGAGITVRYNDMRAKLQNDRKLKRQISKIKRRIINN